MAMNGGDSGSVDYSDDGGDDWSGPEEWADECYGIEYGSDTEDCCGSHIGMSTGSESPFGSASDDDDDDDDDGGGDDDDFASDPCAICMASMDGADSVAVYDCAHRYHFACALEWNVVSASCPQCKRPAVADADMDEALCERRGRVHVPWLDDTDDPPYALARPGDADAGRYVQCLTPGCTYEQLVLGSELRAHYARHCSPRQCDDCHAHTTAALIERHRSTQCPRRWLLCPAGDCQTVIVYEAWRAVQDADARSPQPVLVDGRWYASAAAYLVEDHQCTSVVRCGACPRISCNEQALNEHCAATHTGADIDRALPRRQSRSAAVRARANIRGSDIAAPDGFVRNWTM